MSEENNDKNRKDYQMKSASKIKPTMMNVKKLDMRIQRVKFPKPNKNGTIDEYKQELQKGYNIEQVWIEEIMLFSGVDYEVFCNNLLTGFDWLRGKGGFDSDYEPANENKQTLSEDDRVDGACPQKFHIRKNVSYAFGILCINTDNNEMIIVNPEGCDYARHVGFVS